jgi:hypothetical protein
MNSEEDRAIAVLCGYSMDKLLNTVDLIEGVVARNGLRNADKLALEFCKQNYLPRMNAMELASCLGKAVNRKMLTINPDEGEQERPSIIH